MSDADTWASSVRADREEEAGRDAGTICEVNVCVCERALNAAVQGTKV